MLLPEASPSAVVVVTIVIMRNKAIIMTLSSCTGRTLCGLQRDKRVITVISKILNNQGTTNKTFEYSKSNTDELQWYGIVQVISSRSGVGLVVLSCHTPLSSKHVEMTVVASSEATHLYVPGMLVLVTRSFVGIVIRRSTMSIDLSYTFTSTTTVNGYFTTLIQQ